MSELTRETICSVEFRQKLVSGPERISVAEARALCDLALRALEASRDAGQPVCLGTQQFAILSMSQLGSGECPICRQQVQVSPQGIAYAHLSPPSPSAAGQELGGRAIRALRSLEQTAIMLEKHAPEIFPEVNDKGQVHFCRAMMEAAAEAIRNAWQEVCTAPTTGNVHRANLEWAAKWIEDSASGLSEEIVKFAKNMAMTIRAEARSDPSPEPSYPGWNDRGIAHPDDVFGALPGEAEPSAGSAEKETK